LICGDALGGTTDPAAATGTDWTPLVIAILGAIAALATMWAAKLKKEAVLASNILTAVAAGIEKYAALTKEAPNSLVKNMIQAEANAAHVEPQLNAHLVGLGLADKPKT